MFGALLNYLISRVTKIVQIFHHILTFSSSSTSQQTMLPSPILNAAKTATKTVTTTSTKVKALKPTPTPPRLLVLSLGNPPEYDGTRHSVGHYILSKLTRRLNAIDTRVGRYESAVIHDVEEDKPDIWLYRVPGYMNLSGKSVAPFIRTFTSTIGSAEIVVLFDELDLDLGKVKIRKRGSSHRGHNGLRDIQKINEIGKEYTGIQIGIGRYYNGDKNTEGVVAKYVLSKFRPEEREIIDDVVVDRVIALLKEMQLGKYIFEKVKS